MDSGIALKIGLVALFLSAALFWFVNVQPQGIIEGSPSKKASQGLERMEKHNPKSSVNRPKGN